jgi:hypothetical protein
MFVYKLWSVRIYCLRKQASYECFQLFAVFLLVTFFIIATIVHNIIVNTDYRRLQVSTGTRNSFSEDYGQFGHELWKRFASPALGYLNSPAT